VFDLEGQQQRCGVLCFSWTLTTLYTFTEAQCVPISENALFKMTYYLQNKDLKDYTSAPRRMSRTEFPCCSRSVALFWLIAARAVSGTRHGLRCAVHLPRALGYNPGTGQSLSPPTHARH